MPGRATTSSASAASTAGPPRYARRANCCCKGSRWAARCSNGCASVAAPTPRSSTPRRCSRLPCGRWRSRWRPRARARPSTTAWSRTRSAGPRTWCRPRSRRCHWARAPASECSTRWLQTYPMRSCMRWRCRPTGAKPSRRCWRSCRHATKPNTHVCSAREPTQPTSDMTTTLHSMPRRTKRLPPLRVGVGGPVGSGKTTLVEMLCKAMRERWDLVVVTNDIYTKEDQRLLTVAGALAPERIMGVETGGCPHTAIREDASINLEAVDRMLEKFPDADIVFIESGGDNLAATFSPELSDLTIYVIDVAAGEKIPRKGGPGITKSDLFVINKIDLAPYVGADLSVMEADTRRMRPGRPHVMTNLKTLAGLDEVVAFIERRGLLAG